MRHLLPLLAAFAFLLTSVPTTAAEWQHPLSLEGDGYWKQRLLVTVENRQKTPLDGWPVVVAIGDQEGQAPLVGQAAQAIRVVDEQGTELISAVRSPRGDLLERGPIPAGSELILPAECPAQGTSRCWVYFDNPSAGEVPDLLPDVPELRNGDVEEGEGDAPKGWYHDAGDAQHQASWSDEQPHSGKRCLKLVVAPGAEPTWIASRQGGIRILGGVRYRIRAWVKAQNVQGTAGWYLHLGNRSNPLLAGPMLNAGQGSFDWKEVSLEFTAPEKADRLGLGTVLHGTGTAWFDQVTLECLEPTSLTVRAERPERHLLQEIGQAATWALPSLAKVATPDRRLAARVYNFTDALISKRLVLVDGQTLAARSHVELSKCAVLVDPQGQVLPSIALGNKMLFEVSVPPQSVVTHWIYGWDQSPEQLPEATATSDLLLQQHNLVKNGDFEAGTPTPEGWTTDQVAADSGITLGVDNPGRAELGRQCARLHVPENAAKQWRGWRQTIPVQPGKTYLLQAWLKTQDIKSVVTVHLHRRQASGELCSELGMRSMGQTLTGNHDWTLLSERLTMPADAASLQIHLTMNDSGTVWHDNLSLVEVTPALAGSCEGRPVAESEGLVVWPVPAVVKVFPDDPVPVQRTEAAIAVARNEKEPLQLALRSGRDLAGLEVQLDPPVGPQGAKLDSWAINVVGYVPIDYPTNYYHSLTPPWQRKFPTSHPGCDGWRGWWPDPLLPGTTLDLTANRTGAVWLTVTVGKQQPAGEYRGRVRLVQQGQTVAETPLTVRVRDFTLPDENHLLAIYDVGPTGSDWSLTPKEGPEKVRQWMAANRLAANMVPVQPVFRYEKGEVSVDFTEYDRAAEHYFNELKLRHSYMPYQFYMFGWGFPPKEILGERPYEGEPPYKDADRSQLRPEYKKAFQACLKAFWEHVKAKGWAQYYTLYISDEPFADQPAIRAQMKALCAMIHEVDPQIRIYSSTWKHVPEWDGSLDVWGVGHYGVVPTAQLAKLREDGAHVWFTTDGQMCTDTPYCAVERLLPYYCFKYNAEAYEFWGIGWLTYDPYRFGWHRYIHQTDEPGKFYFVRYPNGDGYLLYPGKTKGVDGPVSSVRAEQAREGVEDFEYLYVLRNLLEKAKAAGRDVAAAEQALEQAQQLVTIPNAGGRFSSKILPHPQALYDARQAVAEAIEQLQR